MRKNWLWFPGVVLSATLTFFSFPPFALGGLMPVALVPFFLAMDTAPNWKAAAFRTWVGVFLGNAAICFWVVHTVREFAGLPIWLSFGTLAALSLWEQAAWPIVAGLRHELRRRRGSLPIFWTSAALVGVELVWPKVFPNTIGYGFYRLPWVVQAADLVGVAGLTFLCVATNEAVALALLPGGKASEKRRHLTAASLLLIAVIVYGGWRHGQVSARMAAPKDRLRVAIIQPNVNSLRKVRAELDRDNARREVLSQLLRQTEEAQPLRPELVFWPETAFPGGFVAGLLDPEGPVRDFAVRGLESPSVFGEGALVLTTQMQATGTHLLFGTPLVEPEGRYNGLVLLSPEAPFHQSYRKSILLELGEYVPLVSRFPGALGWFKGLGSSNYRFGRGPMTLYHPKARLGPMICLEGLYPGYVRRIALEGAEILVNATNDAWFGPGMEPSLHLYLTAFRAVETRRPLVRSTNTGFSAVVDIDGSVRGKTNLFEEATLVDDVPVYDEWRSPYLRFGDWPVRFAGLVALLVWCLSVKWPLRWGKMRNA